MDINNIVNSTRIRNARLLDDINNKILNREYYKFKYLPIEGALPGLYFQQQTEDAINDIGNVAYATEQVADEALKIAQQAYNIALAALETANNALATAQAAQQTADTALNIANNALSVGTAAAVAAAAAQNRADEAYDLADAAQKAADAAQNTADAAQKAANSAANDAKNALTKAEDTLTKIEQLSVLNYYNNLTEATDVNTLVDIHRWYLQASNNPNAPETNPGFLNVDNDHNDSVCKQLWVSETTGAIYNRFGQIVENSDPATVSSWSEWYKLATKADIDGTTTALTERINTVANNLATHEADVNNPHKVTAEQLGLTTVYQYKGSVATYADLPTTGQKVGDVWNVETADPDHGIKAGDNVAWDGAQWDILGGNHDLSGYAQLNSANTFTALNTFRANIAVSNGTAAGSQGQVIFGVKPSTATVQANIISSSTGALKYIATENTGHYFRIGNNTASTSITTNDGESAIFSHNAFEFARVTNVGVARWLGNANTATKLETARTINGVAFDGTKDITIEASGYAQLNSANTFTALNTFRANIAVSNGTAAGSQGQVIFGVKPSTATVQANIISSSTGALKYIATENTGHYFRIGNNTASTSITTNDGESAIFSHNAFEFARVTNVGVARWLGNANTATKLETARTINGVAFDGTKDITIEASGYAQLNSANTFTGTNTFNKPITVRDGALAGIGGTITLGMKPNSATTQAKINSTTTGAMYYTATEGLAHFFNVGTTEVANIGGTANTATLDLLSNHILFFDTKTGLTIGGGGTDKTISFYPEGSYETIGMNLSNQTETIDTDYSILSLQRNSHLTYTNNAALQVGSFKFLEIDKTTQDLTLSVNGVKNGTANILFESSGDRLAQIDYNGTLSLKENLIVGSTANTNLQNGVIRAGNSENCLYFCGTAENTYYSTPNTGNVILYQSSANCYLLNCAINNPSSLTMNFEGMDFKATVGSVPYMCKTLTFWLPLGATVPAVTWTFPTGSAVYYPKGVAPILMANANNIINVIAIVDDTGGFSIQVCETVVLPYSG
jgi:hypothetical protein